MRRCILRRTLLQSVVRRNVNYQQCRHLQWTPARAQQASSPRPSPLSPPPPARSLLGQLNDELESGRLTDAIATHDRIIASGSEEKDDDQTNLRLVQAMCRAEDDHVSKIRQILLDFTERGVQLNGRTLGAIVQRALRHGASGDVAGLLKKYTKNLTRDEKRFMRRVLVQYIISDTTSKALAWECYMLLRLYLWHYLDRKSAEDILRSFYRRGRCDMACYLISHLAEDENTAPDENIYLIAFENIAAQRDFATLKIVHNFLKVSNHVDPNTALYNTLMKAYSACSHYDPVVSLWHDTRQSLEGPDRESIMLALRACRNARTGYDTAQDIWSQVQASGVAVDVDLMTAYVRLLVQTRHVSDAQAAVASWSDGEVSGKLTAAMAVSAHVPEERTKIEEWMKEKYPAAEKEHWTEVAILKKQEHAEYVRMFLEDEKEETEEDYYNEP